MITAAVVPLLLASANRALAGPIGPQPSSNVPSSLLPDELSPSTALILNQCPYDVHIRTCGLKWCSDTTTLSSDEVYTAPYPPPGVQGYSLKISTQPALLAPALQFEVAQRNGGVWYDASAEDGNPFINAGFVMAAQDEACGRVECSAAMAGACESLYKPGEDEGRARETGYPLSCGAQAASGLVLCTG